MVLVSTIDLHLMEYSMGNSENLKKLFIKNAEQFDELMTKMLAKNDFLQEQLNNLLFAVESKFSGETRYETALRYIHEVERLGIMEGNKYE